MVPIRDPLEVFVKKVGITEESELQIRRGIEDNSKIISIKTYVVTPH